MNNSTPIWQVKPVAVATLPVPGWECVFGRNDCALRDITFWVWILRCGNQVALIDTGLPVGASLDKLNRANQTLDPSSVFTVHRSLSDVLREENLAPEDIDFVLITQLITYATGGMLPALLPKARVYCAWEGMREFLTAMPGHPPREFYLTPESWAWCRDLLIENRLFFAEQITEIAPGLRFEPTGGHHPGSAGVRVQTAAGVVGILETAFIQENITLGAPIGIAEDAARCREVIKTYRQECDLAIAGHEPKAAELLAQFMSLC